MIKPELLAITNELFAIGGNHNIPKLIAVRNKLLEFIKINEYFLTEGGELDENFIIAKDTIRLIDASNIYANTNNSRDAYHQMKPFFERVKRDFTELNYYDIELIVCSIEYTKSAEEAHEIATKALKKLVDFRDSRNTNMLEGALAVNVCACLLRAKYSNYDSEIDLTETFDTWFSRLERLVEKAKRLEYPFLLTQVRQAIFYKNQEQINACYEQLKASCDEDIISLISNEIEFYINAESYTNLKGEV